MSRPDGLGGRPRGPPPAIPLAPVKDEPVDEQLPLAIADCQSAAWGLHSELDVDADAEVKQEVRDDYQEAPPSPRPGPSRAPDADPWWPWLKTEACESDDDDVILLEPEVPSVVISSDDDEDDQDAVRVVDVKLAPPPRAPGPLADGSVAVKQEPPDRPERRANTSGVVVKQEPVDDCGGEGTPCRQDERGWAAVKQEPDDGTPRALPQPGGAVVKQEPFDEQGEGDCQQARVAVKQEGGGALATVKKEPRDGGQTSAGRLCGRPCPARFKPNRPCPLRFKLKQERRSEDEGDEDEDEAERAARASLFGRQASWGDDDDDGAEAEDAEMAEEPSSGATLARPSTTLYPAVKPTLDPETLEALRRKSHEYKERWRKAMQPSVVLDREKCERLARLCAKVREDRERTRAAAPRTIDAPPMPRRRAHLRAISVEAAHALQALHRQSEEARARRAEAGAGAAKRPQPQAAAGPSQGRAPAPAAAPRRVSDASTDSSEDGGGGGLGRKQRTAHTPPQWYQDDEDSSHSATAASPTAPPSPHDPRIKKRSRSCSDADESPSPPVPSAPKRRPPLLATPNILPPLSTPAPVSTWKRQPPPSNPSMPASKRVWDDGDAFQSQSVPKIRDPRLTKVKSEELAVAACSGSRGRFASAPEPGPASSEDEEDAKPALPPPLKASGSAVRVLPPATHLNNSGYETRSPLYQEDDQPRKRYDSCDSKGGVRSLSQPSWLDSVLFWICKWRPSWLKECKRLDPHKNPTLLPNMENFNSCEPKLQYPSKHSYLQHFQDLLLLELWEDIKRSKSVEDMKRNKKPNILVAVDGVLEKPLLGEKKRITLVCQCGYDGTKPFELGDLVVINHLKATNNSQSTNQIFAYVETKCTPSLVSQTNKLSPLLIERKYQEPNNKLSFKITLCLETTHEIATELFHLKKIENIYEQIETFKHLYDFVEPISTQHNSLLDLVLNPVCIPPVMPLPDDIPLRFQLADLNLEQKCVAFSLIHDIRECDNSSINVVEGGAGTGKTHLAAALAQELIELSPKHKRDCVVFLATKTNAELNIIGEKLKARNLKPTGDPQSKDNSFRAVWLGNDQYAKGFENLCEISINKLRNRFIVDQGNESLKHRISELEKEKRNVDRKVAKLASRNMHDASLKKESAELQIQLSVLNKKLENNPAKTQRKDAIDAILQNCDIFLTTLSSSYSRVDVQCALKKKPRKRVLIIDNSSEITEPTVLKFVVVYGITDLVLFGDLLQIGPYILSKLSRSGGLSLTLMERYKEALKKGKCPPMCRCLTKQIRLQPEVFSIVNDIFYFGYGKMVAPSVGKIGETDLRPYIWFNCTYFEVNNKLAYSDEEAFVLNLLHAVQEFKIYKSNDKRHIRVVSLDFHISCRLKANKVTSEYYDAPDQLTSKECDIMIVSIGPSTDSIRKERLLLCLTRACKSLFVCGNFSKGPSGVLHPLLKNARDLKVLEDITSAPMDNSILMLKIRKS